VRTLPLRVPITPGESLDSWLEALARRNGLTIGRLLPSLGWQAPHFFSRLMVNVPAPVLRGIEHQAGLPLGRLDEAVLDRYLPVMPARRVGSRYCPGCLAASGGRWLLAWHLPWVFACTHHRILLCDTCPGCGHVPRVRYGVAGLNPAGSCPAAQGGSTSRYCATDLRAAPRRLAPRGPMMAAQHWINTILGIGDNATPVSAQHVIDLEVVARWALRRCSAGDFASFGDHVHRAWQETSPRPDGRLSLAGPFPPASAPLTGAAATITYTILTGDDEVAIARIRALLGQWRGAKIPVRPRGMATQRWTQLSGQARARFLRTTDPSLPPIQRIRHRSGTPLACLPCDGTQALAARARHIPQALWPGWTIRLMPAKESLDGPFRSTIAACLLLPGNPVPGVGQALTELHAHRSQPALNGVLRPLVARGYESVLSAISYLAAYLDTHSAPIDYQRRRDLIPPEVITEAEWQDLCGRAGAHPGRPRAHPGDTRRLLDARRYLYHLLTGADLHDPRHQLAFRTALDHNRYYEFTDPMTAPLRAALRHYASQMLDRLGMDEPVTWEPPPDCCSQLVLPGRDPADIDPQALHQLVVLQNLPVGQAARQLGTTTYHVRFTLESVPRPGRQWGRSTPPSAWMVRQQASQLLTREFFEHEYLKAGKRLRQLADETGFTRPLVTAHAHKAGIPLTHGPTPAEIDKDWLIEQYRNRRRPYADIAAELDVAVMTVYEAARRYGITSRAPGVQSFSEMITKLDKGTPRNIRRAVEGGWQGWHRLRRFQIAMTFPTIEAAAASLGAHQSTLVHQFRRLERDIGATLYYPATPRQAMRPTRRGAALLRALDRPEVRALLHAQAPDPAAKTRATPRPRRSQPREDLRPGRGTLSR
jgi:hypothetical protein